MSHSLMPTVRTIAAMLLAAGSAYTVPYAAAGPKPAADGPTDCFSALARPGGDRLVCAHRAWMTDEERAELQKVTRGYLLDAHCVVAVDIERRLVDEALSASDRAFTLPPQPVTCDLTTSSGPMSIGGTFAPRVVFKDGFAVEATPGLANVTGVNSYLAWPVVAWVNNSPGITGEMAAMINGYRQIVPRQRASR